MHLADAFIQSDLQCYSIQTIHVFVSMCVPWESNPQPFALLTQCSTTEPHRNTFSTMSLTMTRIQRSWKQLAWTFVCVCVCMCVSVFVCPHLTRRLCFSMPSCLGLSANLIWHWRLTAHRSGVLGVCVCVCVFDSTNLCGCVWNYFGVWMPESRQLLVLTGGHKQRWLCETENAAHVTRLANRNSRLILETWDKMKYTSNVISDICFNHKINFTIASWHAVFPQF